MSNIISAAATGLPSTMPRRAFIAGLVATTAAVAVPKPAAASKGDSPDAELIEIGRELDSLYAQHAALNAEVFETEDEWRALFDGKPESMRVTNFDRWCFSGQTFREFWDASVVRKLELDKAPWEGLGQPKPAQINARIAELKAGTEIYQNRLAAFEQSSGRHDRIEQMHKILSKASPLEDRALAIRPTTFAGLAVKARMAREFLPAAIWESARADLDLDQEIIRSIIEDIEAISRNAAVQA